MKTSIAAAFLCSLFLWPVLALADADQRNLEQFRGAQYEHVIRHMGVPTRSAQLPDGRTVAEWSSAQGNGFMVPVPGPIELNAMIPNRHGEVLRLWFDPNGRVIDGSYDRW